MAGGSTQKGLIKAEAPHAAAKLAKGEQMTGTPEWDDVKAASLVGKVVLICITRRTSDGPAYEQMFGRIISGNRSDGFEVALDGSRAGARYSLPPQTDTFVAAQAGEYRLRLTGETVVNPDFLATWIVDPPED